MPFWLRFYTSTHKHTRSTRHRNIAAWNSFCAWAPKISYHDWVFCEPTHVRMSYTTLRNWGACNNISFPSIYFVQQHCIILCGKTNFNNLYIYIFAWRREHRVLYHMSFTLKLYLILDRVIIIWFLFIHVHNVVPSNREQKQRKERKKKQIDKCTI